MTARELQDAVQSDIAALFARDSFKTPLGGVMAAPQVFKQSLPKRNTDDEYEDDPFPYIIVRIDSGGIETQTDPHKIAIIILVGIYDDDELNNGHEAVLEIIERIQQHYEETPALGKFVFTDPFNWALQDEDSYPYYFGAINLTFSALAPRVKRSDLT